MEGVLSEGRIPEVLRDLYVHRRNGFLHFRREQDHRTVVLRRGCIIDGTMNAPGAELGDVMVCDGLLTADELSRAMAAVARTQQPFGVVLQKLGLIEPHRLEDVLALYVREILLGVFSWDDGTFRFEEHELDAAEDGPAPSVSTGEIILDAVRLVNSRSAIRQSLGDLERVLVPATDPLLRFQRIPLTPTDGYILSRIDGTMTARAIVDLLPVPAEEVERSLLGLLCTGMVEFVPAPAERLPADAQALRTRVLETFARLRDSTHFELLGVPLTASPGEVRAAYLRLARLYHPDAQHDPALADLHDHLDQIFARVNAAYEAVSRPGGRASYEEFLGRQQAPTATQDPSESPPAVPAAEPTPEPPPEPPPSPEQVLSDAEHLFAEGKHWEMIGLTQGALAQARGHTRRRIHLLRGQAYLRHPDRRKQAIQELEAVVGEGPPDAEAHYLLGTAYRDEGLTKRAIGHLRTALELRPNDKRAERALANLETAEHK
jgi:curved DNA-binding protein CbpA